MWKILPAAKSWPRCRDGGRKTPQAALEAARAAQDAWAALPAPTRATALKKLAEGIRGRRTELAAILAEEQAKTLPLAQVEVDFTAEYFDYYAGWARIYEGEIIQSDRPRENILLYRQPHRRGGGHLSLEFPALRHGPQGGPVPAGPGVPWWSNPAAWPRSRSWNSPRSPPGLICPGASSTWLPAAGRAWARPWPKAR